MVQVKRQSATNKKSKTDVLSRIAPIGFEDEGIKINLYGRSATGKTTLWSTFPKPILCIVCSGGGELRSINTKENRKVIRQVVLRHSDEVREIVDFQKEEGQFGTIVLDHSTGLSDMVLKEVLGLDELPTQKSWGMATQQQYGQAALMMKELLRSLITLKGNVVIVAQERDFNNDSESELLLPWVASALSPSVVGWLNPAVDYIARTFIREGVQTKKIKMAGKWVERKILTGKPEYCLMVGPHGTYTTKFRKPRGVELPEVIVDPSYEKILKLIEGE